MSSFSIQDFDSKLKTITQSLTSHVHPKLRESILYTLMNGGKRIRPELLFAIGEDLDIGSQVLTQGAAAVEMVHTYTLIHDDLPALDNDDERRGKATNHKVFGEATALLAGDALMSLAIDTLLQTTPYLHAALIADETAHASTETYARNLLAVQCLSTCMGARGVIDGQITEHYELTQKSNPELLLKIARLKTSSLFEAACLIPAYWAGLKSSEPEFKNIKNYALQLGEVYQILDDLEDAEVTNKNIQSIWSHDRISKELTQRFEELYKLTHNLENLKNFTRKVEMKTKKHRNLYDKKEENCDSQTQTTLDH